MSQMRLIVETRAKFDWTHPPKDAIEAAMRAQADMMASKAAKQLETAIQLLISELLSAYSVHGENND